METTELRLWSRPGADRGVGKWSAFSPVFCTPPVTPVFFAPEVKKNTQYEFSKASHLVLKPYFAFILNQIKLN